MAEALRTASDGPVAEGNVGGGTGMITCDFKAGIGTSSRKLPEALGGYTVGVLVMSNFGMMHKLRVGGLPVGEVLDARYRQHAAAAPQGLRLDHRRGRHRRPAARPTSSTGCAKRVGARASAGSAPPPCTARARSCSPSPPPTRCRAQTRKMVYRMKILLDQRLDPLYEAVIEATEEAILNALCMARDMDGVNGNAMPGAAARRREGAGHRLAG